MNQQGLGEQSARQKTVAILGTGFGGMYAWKYLYKKYPKARYILVNNTNYFLFTPLLHEVATGSLYHRQVVEAVRHLTEGTQTEFVIGNVLSINTATKEISTDKCPIKYDVAVLALGSRTNFFNIPGAEEHSLILKNIADAIKIRGRFIDAFEQAAMSKNTTEKKKILSFVIVGGGPTGVELAAEAAQLLWKTFDRFYDTIYPDDITVTLVTRDPELLMMFHKTLRGKAKEALINKRVQVITNENVAAVRNDGIVLASGKKIDASHVIWAAGVMPNVPQAIPSFELDKGGRVVVDEYLRVKGVKDVYAIGDAASFMTKDNKPLPMLAQVAVQQAKVAAINIARECEGKTLKKFKFIRLGDLVSVGRWHALGDTMGIRWSGPAAWVMWRMVYLFKFFSWSKRVKIAVDWTVDLFYPRDITKA